MPRRRPLFVPIDDCNPHWRSAPPAAQWWTVDANGTECYHATEPEARHLFWYARGAKTWRSGRRIIIPDNVDWRALKRRRPQGQE